MEWRVVWPSLTGRHVNLEPHFVAPSSMTFVRAPLDSFRGEDILSLFFYTYPLYLRDEDRRDRRDRLEMEASLSLTIYLG